MPAYKNVLMIDSALKGCGVGLYCAVSGKASASQFMERGQSEILIPMIQALLVQKNSSFSDLDALIVTIGPGAFTGIRIGIATAKTLGMTLDIPVFGIDTMQALAFGFSGKGRFAVKVDTKRGDFYFQDFDPDHMPASGIEILNDREIASRTEKIVYEEIIGDSILPDCGRIAEIFALQKAVNIFTTDLSPLYLRAADTSQSSKNFRIMSS